MKVLEVISSLKPVGGGETFAVNFSRELSELAQIKVVVLHKDNNKHFIDSLTEKGIGVVILDKTKKFDKKNIKELRKIIIDFNPDVIHTENNAILSTFFALRRTKLKNKINVYHTMHLLPEKECPGFVLRNIYKFIFKHKNYIPVGITEQLANVSKTFYKTADIPFVNNGSNLDNYKNLKPLKDRKYDIVVVGRFSKEKNHAFLMGSFKELVKVYPTVKIALVGGGELFDDIKALNNELGLQNNIEFIGILSDPSKIVNDSKIITLGSLYEANPLTLIEGMSAGCIVVANAVGGIPEIIIDKQNGFLYQSNDTNTYVKLLSEILNNIDGYNEISDYNAKYAQKFSMKNCVNEYYDLFNSFGRDEHEKI